jgi:glycosyltransferase involved in cell wall biosynthesis
VFTGYVHGEDLETLWSHAHAVVLPSTLEGLSIALLEALSYGRCVLVSDIPENVEVVGDVTPTFHSRDVADLARALARLDRDPDLVQRVEERVSRELAGKFRWEAAVGELEALYRDVLDPRGA